MRLIDADALIDDIKRYANEPIKLNDRRWNIKCVAIIQDMIGTVKLQPTIEAEAVVRCKDCENWMNDQVYDDGSCFCPMLDLRTDPGFFCAGGERKKANAT